MSQVVEPTWKATARVIFLSLLFSLFALRAIHRFSKVQLRDGTVSPLYSLIDQFSDGEPTEQHEIMQSIHQKSVIEAQRFVILETIVPVQEGEKLASFVDMQLKGAYDILTPEELSPVRSMVELMPKSSGVMKTSTGDSFSLRNSALLALIKEHNGNIHFAMAAAVIEPHLGLTLISRSERNKWNSILSSVVKSQVRAIAKSHLLQKPSSEAANKD